MARSSLIEDLFRLSSEVPWWVAVGTGGGSFYFLKYYAPSRMSQSLQPAWEPMFSVLAFGVLAICLLGALVGLSRRLRERRIFSRQTSINSIRDLSWADFERLVVEAFRQQGYDSRPTQQGSDGGVDVVLEREGRTSLVQCKQWKNTRVGVKPIRELAGVVAARQASSGIFVCSGSYTSEAIRFAEKAQIELVDGKRLAKMMNLSVSSSLSTPIDDSVSSTVCPRCGSDLVRREAKRGNKAGMAFIGCTSFPKCRYTRDF